MSSSKKQSKLENALPLDGHENNDPDNKSVDESNSKTEQQSKTLFEKKSRKRKYLNKMLHLLKEFLIMVLVAITYAAITNDPPKIGKSPAAYRFFPENSYITDWYRGEISEAINKARSADIAFVMFYAPWDAECQHARKEFQMVAHYMHQEVTFSAVNCWQPGSECKTQYSKFYRWPVLIAYPTHGRGLQYNGPLVAVYMMQFLKKLINPFTRSSDRNVLTLLHKYDAVVAATVNAKPYSREYGVFYQTILMLLEKDPLQEIGVSIQTQPAYDENGELNEPELSLHMWNETMFYQGEWEIEPILNWIVKHVHQVTAWISPSGSKSLSLASHLQPGPALILFTPKNPLASHNDFYSMLREIGQDYNSCGGNNWINVLKLGIRLERRAKYLEHLRLIEMCSSKKIKFRKVVSANLWSNTSYCLENKHQTENPLTIESNMVHYYGETSTSKGCQEVRHQEIVYKTSQLSDVLDDKSPENLRNHLSREVCRKFLIAQKYQPSVFSSELYNTDENYNITGLKCRTNKSLSFISMDSLYYHHYAEKLGIDLSKKPNKAAAVILDDKMESHYIMAGAISESNLKGFIYNYTRGSLKRALRSLATIISKNTHAYPNNQHCSSDDDKFCIKELYATNFLETVSQKDRAVIIFYYSKQCSFCNGISYRFLTVSKYFASMRDFQFARIDGDLNLIPWEYTMETYPTILFIPPNKIAESRVFPMEMPITVPNLIGFILANLDPPLKLQAMWTLCDRTKFYSNATECHLSLRLQISSSIEKVLQEWRWSSNEEKIILSLKLQQLHALQNLFIEDTQNISVVQYHFSRLKLIEKNISQPSIEVNL
ncbi:hypothetical protein HHI36_015500 [Cryptolaemus montrouzieri]|uniref:Thioredoxin domain-containing protein n=1 Tax=Cryptolaemus montrouzieri TaxID=559131 RepID=A0ABD2N5X9_9CUCU